MRCLLYTSGAFLQVGDCRGNPVRDSSVSGIASDGMAGSGRRFSGATHLVGDLVGGVVIAGWVVGRVAHVVGGA